MSCDSILDENIGKIFGNLKIIQKVYRSNRAMYECSCSCGKTVYIQYHYLKTGKRTSCGCRSSRALDLTGKKFGKLLAIKNTYERTQTKAGGFLWEFKCDCGNTHKALASDVKRGKIKSCGCIKEEFLAKRKESAKTNTKTIENNIFREYKIGAKARGLVFELSPQVFVSLIYAKCFYCGVDYSRSLHSPSFKDLSIRVNGIDRKNSNLGYTEENCVPCCSVCNYKKSTTSFEDFLLWIRTLYKNTLSLNIDIDKA